MPPAALLAMEEINAAGGIGGSPIEQRALFHELSVPAQRAGEDGLAAHLDGLLQFQIRGGGEAARRCERGQAGGPGLEERAAGAAARSHGVPPLERLPLRPDSNTAPPCRRRLATWWRPFWRAA